MITYNKESAFKPYKNTVLTVGSFDGLHLGHQHILKTLKRVASEHNGQSVVISFDPNPQALINKNSFAGQIDTRIEKIKKIENFGIDVLLLLDFDKNIMKMPAIDFLNHIIVKRFSPKVILSGFNHFFGFNREGNFDFLKTHRDLHGFELIKIEEQFIDKKNISSSQIRKDLKNGDIESANKSLNDAFSISGKVVKGKGYGKTIGFPTANIEFDRAKIIPKKGVYLTEVLIDGEIKKGMCNIGTRPTVSDKNTDITIEVHIFNLSRNIYGKNIQLKFLFFLRDEKKFKSIEMLKNQLVADQNKCLEYCNNNV